VALGGPALFDARLLRLSDSTRTLKRQWRVINTKCDDGLCGLKTWRSTRLAVRCRNSGL
jgi:hypothetical protein